MKTRCNLVQLCLLGMLLLVLPAAVQAQFTFTTNSGAITITGYTGSGGVVTIPDTINGYPVTSIGTNAFDGCTSLTGITIPISVTNIGDDAFEECVYLTSVTIPDSVTSIGTGAFFYCYRLTSVTIPNSVTTIGDGAFVFCSFLTGISVAAGNSFYSSVNGVLFNSNQTVLVEFPGGLGGSYTIPNSVTNIGDDAFEECSSLTSVMIPNSVTSIGQYAFAYCAGLANAIIGTNVTGIGDDAFYNCYNLTSVTIPNSVTSIGQYAFAYCAGLTNAIIGTNVTSIGDDAFYNCYDLASITIPDSVTNIEVGVFEDCSHLTAINVAAGNSFYSSVNGVLFNSNQTVLVEFPCGLGGSYTIPNSVTSIGQYAFAYCAGLTNAIIGTNVTSIGDDAFYNCYDLASVTIPNSVTIIGDGAFFGSGLTNITIPNSVTIIGDEAFEGNLSNVTIGNSVTSIGDQAFFNDNLTSVTIPNSVTSIGQYAFAENELTNVTIGNSVTSIGDYAFQENKLTSVTIPNSVTSIGQYAFAENELTNVTIGNSVTSIGDYAFYDCTSLEAVYFQGNAPTADSTVFQYDPVTIYYVPGTTGWATFASSTGLTPVLWASGVQFTANPTNVPAGLIVQFYCPNYDYSGNLITNWNWSFGDAATSTNQNPSHVYTTVGSFTPVLIAMNSLGALYPGFGPSFTVSPPPVITATSLSKTNLMLMGTNGFSGLTYYVLAGTNLTLPKSQWIPVDTNIWSGNGIFSFIVTNDISGKQRFYRLAIPSSDYYVLQDNFDPTIASDISSFYGGDAANTSVGVVSGVGVGGLPALQIQSSFNNGPNGYGYLGGQWQDQTVSGNTDTNLGDYNLSFDAYVTGDATHQLGGGFELTLQETAGQNFSTPFPQGQLQTTQGMDLLVPQSGVWKHFNINLAGTTFQSPNGSNSNFSPTGGTWQIIFQMNSVDWGSEPQTNSTLIIDNLTLTVLTPP